MENQKNVNVTNAQENSNHQERKDEMRRYRDAYGSFLRPFLGLFDDDFAYQLTQDEGMMKTDIVDTGNDYLLSIEVPGVKKDAIKVSLDKGYLTISYKLEENEKENEGKRIHVERRQGFYRRDYFVGYDVKKDSIKASLSDGILTVNVPKLNKNGEEDKFINID